MTTPLRKMLDAGSALRGGVVDGLGAVERAHKGYIDAAIRDEFADSLALDDALRAGHEQENRWDYLLGHRDSGKVVGLEPHSAKSDEVSTVIAKRRMALRQLRGHMKRGARVSAWYWVASGSVDFLPFDKAVLTLANEGITFVGKKLLQKHLPR